MRQISFGLNFTNDTLHFHRLAKTSHYHYTVHRDNYLNPAQMTCSQQYSGFQKHDHITIQKHYDIKFGKNCYNEEKQNVGDVNSFH